MKPHSKHPLKVHVCGGISSYGGDTPIVIFTGTLVVTKIFETGLIQLCRKCFFFAHPNLMQDNDPKHSSKLATPYLQNNGQLYINTL